MTNDEKVEELIDVLINETVECEICKEKVYKRQIQFFPPIAYCYTINDHLFCKECACKIYYMTQNKIYLSSVFESISENIIRYVSEEEKSIFYYNQLVNSFESVQHMVQHMKKIEEIKIQQKMLSVRSSFTIQL